MGKNTAGEVLVPSSDSRSSGRVEGEKHKDILRTPSNKHEIFVSAQAVEE